MKWLLRPIAKALLNAAEDVLKEKFKAEFGKRVEINVQAKTEDLKATIEKAVISEIDRQLQPDSPLFLKAKSKLSGPPLTPEPPKTRDYRQDG